MAAVTSAQPYELGKIAKNAGMCGFGTQGDMIFLCSDLNFLRESKILHPKSISAK